MSLSKSNRRPGPAPRALVRNARPPTVEALEPRLAPDAAGSAQVVGQLYHDLLQRTPDPSGLAHWSAALVSGLTRSQVAQQIASSPEFHDNQVRALYQRILHRDADPSGLDHWSGALDQGLLTEDAIAALLVGSAESADLARDDSLIAPLGGDGGITPAATGFTTPLLFQGINPIRVVDTRFAATASVYGEPAFSAGETRSYDLVPNVAPNDLPAGVKALVLTVSMVEATGSVNYVTIWPTGSTMPPTASMVTDHAGALASSAVITAVDAAGSIDVFAYGATHLVIDITGYFLDDLQAGDRLAITGTYDSGSLVSASNASTTASVSALLGTISSASAGGSSAGVRGVNAGTGASGIGVWGSQDGTGYGVYGSVAGAGTGVYGEASGIGSEGVYGSGETGVYGSGSLYGVLGQGIYGLRGEGTSFGVYATASTGTAVTGLAMGSALGGYLFSPNGTGLYAASTGASGYGIRTQSGNIGIYASGTNYGLQAESTTNVAVTGTSTSSHGVKGLTGSNASAGVYGDGTTYGLMGEGTLYGVYSYGNYGGTGSKYFVDPHPTDPTKQINYVTLEGPENGIYYRGTGHFTDGVATVSFPDYFTWEAEAEGLSVTITPIGQLALTAVQTITPEGATLLSSADVDFFYTVNGIRAGYADFNPIQENTGYRPRGADSDVWRVLNDVQKARLVATGVFNADGTVNVDTANRLGWDTPEYGFTVTS